MKEPLNKSAVAADSERVTRGLGMIAALISLAVVGALFALQSKGGTQAAVSPPQARSEALAVAGRASFQPVEQLLQVSYAQTGTYAGATLPLGTGVTVVSATSSSYCLQADFDGSVLHESGPGGSPVAGPC